ncbi:hypothetical protein CC86DRAFT_406187 [Ophiobolus disseminans]|uniref:Uncharacterized protein n=1 Tax=Ophiobolus disseminans TaxID=1469910 RepID=A0A6A7A113_9PLEO|nr:hypothetical protein CC86DRAFT_406187 [Ophiobolus disseminans]
MSLGQENMVSEAEKVYRSAVAKGQKLLNIMRTSDEDACRMLDHCKSSASSRLLTQDALKDWGYAREMTPSKGFNDELIHLLSHLGITLPASSNLKLGPPFEYPIRTTSPFLEKTRDIHRQTIPV